MQRGNAAEPQPPPPRAPPPRPPPAQRARPAPASAPGAPTEGRALTPDCVAYGRADRDSLMQCVADAPARSSSVSSRDALPGLMRARAPTPPRSLGRASLCTAEWSEAVNDSVLGLALSSSCTQRSSIGGASELPLSPAQHIPGMGPRGSPSPPRSPADAPAPIAGGSA